MNKKAAALEGLQNLVVPLVGVGIVLVVGFLIMSEAGSQAVSTESGTYANCNAFQNETNSSGRYCGYGVNGTISTINAMAELPQWLPVIVITVIGAILMGLIAAFRR